MRELTSRQWYAIALCALAVVFDGYDGQMLAMAIPLMAKEFAVAPTAFAYAGSASLAGMAVGALLLSPLADRQGRGLWLLVSLLLFGLPTLLAMQAAGPTEMTFWRFLAGCGMGAAVPVTIAIVADIAPATRRVQIVAMMASGFAVGASSAGLIAPLLSAPFGWRGLFAYGGVMPLVLAALVWRGVPESRSLARAASTQAAAAQSAAAQSAAANAPAPSVVSLFTPHYRSRSLLLWALNAINLFANYGLATWLPTLLVQNGWTLASASRIMAVLSIGALSGCWLASRLIDQKRIALGLGGGYAVAALSLGLCATNPAATWVWVVLLICVGFGAIGTMLTLGPLAAAYYPETVRSTGVGWANGMGRFGSLFGPLALAWLMNQHLAPTSVLGALMVPLFCCVVLALLLPRALLTPADSPPHE